MGKVKYKLKSDNYREAAFSIMGLSGNIKSNGHQVDNFSENSIAHNRIKEAGVTHWFEKVYEKEGLEIGNWYKVDGKDHTLIFITRIEPVSDYRKIHYYGIRKYKWQEDYIANSSIERSLKLANKVEIERILTKEAKKRYKTPCKVNYLDSGVDVLRGHTLIYNLEMNTLGASMFGEVDILLRDGKWAEVVEETTLDGKDVEIDGKKYKLTLIK